MPSLIEHVELCHPSDWEMVFKSEQLEGKCLQSDASVAVAAAAATHTFN